MKTNRLVGIILLFSLFTISSQFAGNLSAADDKVVATVKEEPIKASDVAAHMEATKLPRDEALNDLIEQKQVRIVAAEKGVSVPAGNWSTEQRAKIDAALVKALSLPIPNYVGDAVVDHAYVKLEQKDGLALMERLRALVEKGATIPAAFNELQLDGTNWHIGDHEEYPVSALPDETRELPDGGLTKIIVGSEGYNLFKIYERKIPVEEIRQAVRIYLIEHTFDLVNVVEE
jgi:hypothetical protein